MNIYHKNHDFLIGRFGHDTLHEWIMKNNVGDDVDPIIINKVNKMGPNEFYFDYYNYVSMHQEKHVFFSKFNRLLDLRAELVGVKKSYGFQIKISNKENYKIVYDITFKDDINIINLPKNVINSFLQDIKKCENILKTLIDYVALHGNFNNKIEINNIIHQWRKDFDFLFRF